MVKLVLVFGLAAFFLPWWQIWLLKGEYSWLGIPIPSYLVAPFVGDATFYGVIPFGIHYDCWVATNCGIIGSSVESYIPIVALLTFLGIIFTYLSLVWKRYLSILVMAAAALFFVGPLVFIPAGVRATENLYTSWETTPPTSIACVTFPIGSMDTAFGVLNWGFGLGFYGSIAAGFLALSDIFLLWKNPVRPSSPSESSGT